MVYLHWILHLWFTMSQQIRSSVVNKLFIMPSINHALSVPDFMRTVIDKFCAISPMVPLIVINRATYVTNHSTMGFWVWCIKTAFHINQECTSSYAAHFDLQPRLWICWIQSKLFDWLIFYFTYLPYENKWIYPIRCLLKKYRSDAICL